MKNFWTFAIFLSTFLTVPTFAQTPAERPLKSFASEQLIACMEDAKVCGSSNIYAIADVLVSRLPKLPTRKLVECLGDWKVCGAADSLASGTPVSDEIARRGNPHALFVRYWSEPNAAIREGIIDVAYHFHTPEAHGFMKQVFVEHRGSDQDLYSPANYLARYCDLEALRWLSSRDGRLAGCMQWTDTVAMFGKCRYRPAIPYLIENSLDDACLNIVDAADKDLRDFFPHTPKEFKDIPSMQAYYCKQARREGFNISCNTN